VTCGLEPVDGARRRWQAIGDIYSAHATMLRHVELIDDDALATLLGAIQITSAAPPPDGKLAALVVVFDQRIDAIVPSGMSGAARVGRGTPEVIATVLRLVLRQDLVDAIAGLGSLCEALIGFAERHVVTLMPAYLDGQVAQPTTLGHLTGAIVSAIARASDRFLASLVAVNQSPMGSGSLASTGMPIDRSRVAELLGFDGPVVNTLDAVAATDHVTAAADAVAAAAVPIRRFAEVILQWIRAEPGSFRLPDSQSVHLPDLPQARVSTGLHDIATSARRVEASARTVRELADQSPWGPSLSSVDPCLSELDSTIAGAMLLYADARNVVEQLDVNRALLANRAGKSFSTSSDLADFLMIEEQIEPGAARDIAALTISRAREQGMEAAGITAELIDGAALLVIGREIKAEFEAISRYLAPRRFVERRTAIGAPSPASTRAALEDELKSLRSSQAALGVVQVRIARAHEELASLHAAMRSSIGG
jgi:argininosuccinate lyase